MKAIIDSTPVFKVSDPMPDGYIARHDWAAVHLKAGLKQEMCARCCCYFFPHQLSPKVHTSEAILETRSRGKRNFQTITLTHRCCIECEANPTKKGREK